MKLTVYPLYTHVALLEPIQANQTWIAQFPHLAEKLALSSSNLTGWDMGCPYAFEAAWNGGPAPDDIQIRLPSDLDLPPFVRSYLGHGIITFSSGYQCKTEDISHMWVRGSINQPKDGIAPLEQLVETHRFPVTITVHWKFTRPDYLIRFAHGESFGILVPYPHDYLAQCDQEIAPLENTLEDQEARFEAMLRAPEVQTVLKQFKSVAPETEQVTPASDWPAVSCICPTYGRVELLEEAIYSFLQQDYRGPKELIILNDYHQQNITFEHPEVRIINVPRQFQSVGEKYKAAAALCTHDRIFVWHDDDIYLPHRLSWCMKHLDTTSGFLKADKAWFWNNGKVSGPEHNIFHGGSCWTRQLFITVRGYPHIDTGYDIGFEQLCEEAQAGATTAYDIAPQHIYYIYRWAGTGSYHLSAFASPDTAMREVVQYVAEQAARGVLPQGHISLKPHWKADYPQLVADYLAAGQVPDPQPEEEPEPFPPPLFAIRPPAAIDAHTVSALFTGTYPRKISVILPTLNDSVLLQRTVEQFARTLPDNSEVIVVDNGSTDGSSDFLLGAARNDVKLIRTPNPLGVVGARNKGLEQAQGEIVAFADAHIDVPARWWQPIAALLQREEVGVIGPAIGVMGKPDYPLACGQRIAEPNLRVEWLAWKGIEPYPVPSLGGGFMAMRHDTLKTAGAFDGGMLQWGSEDLELCLRYWLLGYEVWVVPDVIIMHYFRTRNPYTVEFKSVTHNTLRVALLHFNQERIGRVLEASKNHPGFAQALAMTVDSDVWQWRVALAACRVRDDSWFFERFQDTCLV